MQPTISVRRSCCGDYCAGVAGTIQTYQCGSDVTRNGFLV
jgi:hypothetical protein